MATKTKKRNIVKEAFNKLEGQTGRVASGIKANQGAEIFTKDRSKPEPEQLTPFDQIKKRVYIDLLLKWISPTKLSAKSTPEQDKGMLVKKMEKQTLPDLSRFFELELPVEIQVQIQNKYRDLSP